MKKLVGALAGFLASALIAGPVNTPASSAQFESGLFTGAQKDYAIRVGYVGDYVMDRKLKARGTHEHIDQVETWRNGVALGFNVLERFEISVAAGRHNMRGINYETNEPNQGFRTAPGDFWTVGASGEVFAQDKLSVSLFGNYGKSKADIAKFEDNVDKGFDGEDMRSKEWQVGLGISHAIEVSPELAIVPTVSLSYSDAHFKLKNSREKFSPRGKVGASLACKLYAGKVFGLHLEGRMFNEEAVSVKAELSI